MLLIREVIVATCYQRRCILIKLQLSWDVTLEENGINMKYSVLVSSLIWVVLICGSEQQNNPERWPCGVRQYNREAGQKGPGDWPWHVMILPDGYLCSGTLISTKFVLTTSECVSDENGEEIWASKTLVVLGVHEINFDNINYDEIGAQQIFRIHRFKEIALLELYDDVLFTSDTQPACVNQAKNIKGNFATTVGWSSNDGNGTRFDISESRVQLVNDTECRRTFGATLISQVLCVQRDNDTLGGGGALYLKRGNSWQLAGMMTGESDDYLAFVSLTSYIPWMRGTTKLHNLEYATNLDNCQPVLDVPADSYLYMKYFPGQCGEYVTNRISGGQKANVFEFPWMALVLYRQEDIRKLSELCMGTLINARYVLTSAHCVSSSPFAPYRVRLGEHTLDQEEDCNLNDDTDCAPLTRDYDIECTVAHHSYESRSRQNDIGLIRLGKEVILADHIKLVCLPGTYDLGRTTLPRYIISGWGKDESRVRQQVLLKATIPAVDRARCQELYKPFGRALTEDQLCAGGNRSGNSCYGDYGVPLGHTAGYYGTMRFVQFGIASFGTLGCQTLPSVYTNVSYHIGWIIANIRP